MKVSIHQKLLKQPRRLLTAVNGSHLKGLHPEVLSGKEQIELLKIKKLLEDPRISRG